MALFQLPDLTDTFDLAILVVLMSTIFSMGTANVCNTPFIKRNGYMMSYSKFADGTSLCNVPSRWGMTALYFPSMILGLVTVFATPNLGLSTSYGTIVSWLVFVHFAKRVLECLFLHKYSGSMPAPTVMSISSCYLLQTFIWFWYSRKVDARENAWTLPLGLVLYCPGEIGNFYHHYLLAKLRSDPTDKSYKVPAGCLFEYVAAPHYLCEIVAFLGLAFICQHCYGFMMVLFMVIYLGDRANGQHKWNKKRIPDYPEARLRILPGVF